MPSAGGGGASVNQSFDVSVYAPLATNLQMHGAVIYAYFDHVQSYSHEISASGGFTSASITVVIDRDQIEDWVENGLGRHIVVRGADTEVIWEGFVQTLSVSYGSLSLRRGRLHDVANRVSVVYTPIIDLGTDPPTKGTQTETPITEAPVSQSRYGIIEKIVSGGELLDDGTTDAAEELRDLFLQENKHPFTDSTITVGNSSEPSLTLECEGYGAWLDTYVYNYGSVLSTTVTAKMTAVLAADPNGIISTDYSHIGSNLLLVPEGDEENRFARTIINDMINLGDGTDTRWLFGIYEDRVPWFHAMPMEIFYRHYVTEESVVVADIYGNPIPPWAVRPGKWAYMPDVLVTNYMPEGENQYRIDSRAMFVETVRYDMPWSVTLTGSRVSKVSQRLAQLGLRGFV